MLNALHFGCWDFIGDDVEPFVDLHRIRVYNPRTVPSLGPKLLLRKVHSEVNSELGFSNASGSAYRDERLEHCGGEEERDSASVSDVWQPPVR
jgi:hypothetical protein